LTLRLVLLRAGEDIRERTDALDAAGNTTAAIGKGFAIGSAALVSLALFGAYVTRSKIDLIESSILDPKVRMLLCLACSVFCIVMPLSRVGRPPNCCCNQSAHVLCPQSLWPLVLYLWMCRYAMLRAVSAGLLVGAMLVVPIR
jgi:hypothetical protein